MISLCGLCNFINHWYLLAALAGVLAYYHIIWKRRLSYWTSRNIKGPRPLPVYGNILALLLAPKPVIELEWYKKYGRLFGVYFFGQPRLTVADPTLIQQIMVKDFHLFRNRAAPRTNHKVISKIMFNAVDDDWKRIRAIASPTFTSGKLRKMYSLISMCCADYLQDLDKQVTNGRQQVELKQLMGCLTMDVIARCAFATKPNTYSDPDNQFTLRAHRMLNLPFWKGVLTLMLPMYVLTSRPMKLLFGKSGAEDSEFFINLPRALMAERRKTGQKHTDFLQLLMDVELGSDGYKQELAEDKDSAESHHVNEGDDERRADAQAFSGVRERKLTEDEILAQCFLFFIAGYETTATTLSYCTYELALNPDIQERLVEEVGQAFNEKGDIDYDVLSRLPFLDSVISETLRNYPPVVRLERMAGEDVVLKSDDGTTVKVEKGVVVEMPVYAMHHDPEHYPDPFAFRPDRFMPENRHNIKPYTYIPFGVGPRNCIGMRFALLEAKLALAKTIRQFRFFRVADTDVPVVFKTGQTNNLLQATRLEVGVAKR